MDTPVREVWAQLGGDNGLEGRATSCARGSAMLAHQKAAHRVLTPLKRVGPRGSGQWKSISLEQLVQEVCNGGNLFGEGHVDGLRAIRDTQTLIDADNPEYGPKSNQLLFTDASNEGRTPLIRRFVGPAFGSVNFANHGAYCGQTYRVGTAAALGNIPGMPHGKPDWKNSRFGLFLGTAPAQAGNPFQRMGRELAEARSREENAYRYVVVSPVLPTSSSLAAGDNNRWLPIKPATDLALAMALIRWIIDNGRYDAKFLSQPGPAAMAAAGEASWSNATHLLINDAKHPRYGQFLRGADIGLPLPAPVDEKTPAEDVYVVQLADGSLAAHTVAQAAELRVQREATPAGRDRAGSRVQRLHEAARRGPAPDAGRVFRAVRRAGAGHRRPGARVHQPWQAGRGQLAWRHHERRGFLHRLRDCHAEQPDRQPERQGRLGAGRRPFGPFGPGPRYNFAQFPGSVKPTGVALSRTRFPYEKTSEFQRKKAAGQNPYPAKAPWYPAPGNMSSEMLAAGLLGYPYPVKAWINHMSNPVYAIAGFDNTLTHAVKDPKKLPLFISVDPFINETSALADYIVPDTVTYESWGIGAPWADVIAKSSTVRWPVVQPATARTADGQPVNLESFLFAVAKALQLPGFGKGAMSTKDGQPLDLENAEDLYLRAIANIAYQAGKPVGEASDDDIAITGVQPWMAALEQPPGPRGTAPRGHGDDARRAL
ncbi:hypothetical protein MASR1M59_25950 [Melaminivora sp.]